MKLSNNLTTDNVYDSIVSRHPGIWGYDHDQKAFIRRVLEEGLEAKYLIDPRFNIDQTLQIYTGLKNGVDVSKYAKTRMHINQMIAL